MLQYCYCTAAWHVECQTHKGDDPDDHGRFLERTATKARRNERPRNDRVGRSRHGRRGSVDHVLLRHVRDDVSEQR
jgi:hypothetical protein